MGCLSKTSLIFIVIRSPVTHTHGNGVYSTTLWSGCYGHAVVTQEFNKLIHSPDWSRDGYGSKFLDPTRDTTQPDPTKNFRNSIRLNTTYAQLSILTEMWPFIKLAYSYICVSQHIKQTLQTQSVLGLSSASDIAACIQLLVTQSPVSIIPLCRTSSHSPANSGLHSTFLGVLDNGPDATHQT